MDFGFPGSVGLQCVGLLLILRSLAEETIVVCFRMLLVLAPCSSFIFANEKLAVDVGFLLACKRCCSMVLTCLGSLTSTWPAAAVRWVVSSFEIVCIHRGDDRCVVGACTDSYVRTVSKSVS